MVLLADDRIVEYRAEQRAAGELHVDLDVSDDAHFTDIAQSVERTVHTALAGYGCRARAVSVASGVPVRAPGAKRRRVVCSWRQATESPARGVE
jgi:hypothetical protein